MGSFGPDAGPESPHPECILYGYVTKVVAVEALEHRMTWLIVPRNHDCTGAIKDQNDESSCVESGTGTDKKYKCGDYMPVGYPGIADFNNNNGIAGGDGRMANWIGNVGSYVCRSKVT